MKLRFLFLMATTVAFGGPVVAKEELATAEQRFGGKPEQAESPSFRRHVVPLASKLGCSGRECHGSFQGRGDFQLQGLQRSPPPIHCVRCGLKEDRA